MMGFPADPSFYEARPVRDRVVTAPDGVKHHQQCQCRWEADTLAHVHRACPIHGEA